MDETEMTMDTKEFARRIRIHALRMTNRGNSSHIGAVFSMADIVAVLYGGALRVDPHRPDWPERDRFVLSKGHAGAGVYAALAEVGFFEVERLQTHYQDASTLSGHISHKGIPGVELSTGSLGHGLPVAMGMAYGAHLDGRTHRVFVVMSDGECDEGSVWESALFAAHHGLDNLVVLVDYNKIQSLAPVADTITLEPLLEKWRSFGWGVEEIDGHDHEMIRGAIDTLPILRGRPSCIICHTTKGKGVSFMENSVLWHYRTARGAEFDAAMEELNAEDVE